MMAIGLRRLKAGGALLAVCGVAFGACVPRNSGSVTPSGYFNDKYAYSIRPVAGTDKVMPEGWEIDNFYGPPEHLKAKSAGIYSTTYHFDVDGDGQLDDKQDAQTYDLRFVHRSHSGVIWIRTFPISQTLRDKELRVLMQDYLDDVAGAGYESVDFKGAKVVLEKRFAAELRSRESGTLADKPAFAAEFAVANVDQVRVAKDARQSLVKVVIVRPGFVYATRGYWASQSSKGPEFPVLLVLGVAGTPEDFPRALPEFDELLARVIVNGNSGVALTRLQDAMSPAPAAPETVKPAAASDPSPSSAAPAGATPASGAAAPAPIVPADAAVGGLGHSPATAAPSATPAPSSKPATSPPVAH